MVQYCILCFKKKFTFTKLFAIKSNMIKSIEIINGRTQQLIDYESYNEPFLVVCNIRHDKS